MPYIRLIPKVTAVAGDTMQLKCPVAGYPIEEVHWERGGRELPDDLRQKVLPDGTLVVNPVQKKADSGVYTCWARNKQGHSARRSGEVAVIGTRLSVQTILLKSDNELNSLMNCKGLFTTDGRDRNSEWNGFYSV